MDLLVLQSMDFIVVVVEMSDLKGFMLSCTSPFKFNKNLNYKTKQRNRLNVESSLITAVSTLPPELSKLMKDMQAQVSH